MVAPANQQRSTTTVLVVSRQASVANWIGECLKDAGYVVAVARGCDDALCTLCDIKPGAAIVCASKIEGDTEEFLARLAHDSHPNGIPTVLVAPMKIQAALADSAAGSRFRGGYLSRPLNCGDLRLIMRDLLRTDRQAKERLTSGQVVLDPLLRVLRGRAGMTILTPPESRVAEYVVREGPRLISMKELLTRTFSLDPGRADPAFVRAQVVSLRQKIRVVTGGTDLVRPAGRRGFVYLGA